MNCSRWFARKEMLMKKVIILSAGLIFLIFLVIKRTPDVRPSNYIKTGGW